VPSEERPRSVPARSAEQRLRALEKANQVRHERAQLKGELAAGSLRLEHVLAHPPLCAQTARVRELLLTLPGIGPARASRTLAHCRIAETKTIAGLSSRQRAELIQQLLQTQPPR
jgi:guanylate kinase